MVLFILGESVLLGLNGLVNRRGDRCFTCGVAVRRTSVEDNQKPGADGADRSNQSSDEEDSVVAGSWVGGIRIQHGAVQCVSPEH